MVLVKHVHHSPEHKNLVELAVQTFVVIDQFSLKTEVVSNVMSTKGLRMAEQHVEEIFALGGSINFKMERVVTVNSSPEFSKTVCVELTFVVHNKSF